MSSSRVYTSTHLPGKKSVFSKLLNAEIKVVYFISFYFGIMAINESFDQPTKIRERARERAGEREKAKKERKKRGGRKTNVAEPTEGIIVVMQTSRAGEDQIINGRIIKCCS